MDSWVHLFLTHVALLWLFISSSAGQECASYVAHVVLLHGILGWDESEVGGEPHFRHAHILEETGCFKLHIPAMAILGSNWDRAAQVHAQLVGGYADHGIAHSSNPSTQHERYGSKNHTAAIPDFLEPGGLPVYFLVHSLGASTYRQLEILYRHGSDAEKAVTPPGNLSSLYEGGHDGVVAGVIALNGALDGTILIEALGGDMIELIKKVVLTIEALTGDVSADLGVYDPDHGYFGARCTSDSTLDECLDFVMTLPAYNDTNWGDHAGVADRMGAADLNRQGEVTSSEVFYVNYVGNATRPSVIFDGAFMPLSTMSFLLKPLALLMGFYDLNNPELDAWRPNDGIISVRGQECPLLDLENDDHCSEFTTVEDLQPGVWHRIYHTLDHISVIGWTWSEEQKGVGENIWTDICRILRGMIAKRDSGGTVSGVP